MAKHLQNCSEIHGNATLESTLQGARKAQGVSGGALPATVYMRCPSAHESEATAITLEGHFRGPAAAICCATLRSPQERKAQGELIGRDLPPALYMHCPSTHKIAAAAICSAPPHAPHPRRPQRELAAELWPTIAYMHYPSTHEDAAITAENRSTGKAFCRTCGGELLCAALPPMLRQSPKRS